MPKSYLPCGSGHQAVEMVDRLIEETFPGLHEARVSVGVTMARSDRGPAVTHHGDPAWATVKIINTQLRSEGQPDARILVDERAWDDMEDDQRAALLDHELTHLMVKRSKKDFSLRIDEAGRPVLGMRRHDFVLGGFAEVVERRGAAAPEKRVAEHIREAHGQLLWGWGGGGPGPGDGAEGEEGGIDGDEGDDVADDDEDFGIDEGEDGDDDDGDGEIPDDSDEDVAARMAVESGRASGGRAARPA
jgi:hypothetical protein